MWEESSKDFGAINAITFPDSILELWGVFGFWSQRFVKVIDGNWERWGSTGESIICELQHCVVNTCSPGRLCKSFNADVMWKFDGHICSNAEAEIFGSYLHHAGNLDNNPGLMLNKNW